MNSSYNNNDLNYGDLLSSIIYSLNPKIIIEFGILDGFSLKCFNQYSNDSCNIYAYDIFDSFNGNHANKELLLEKFKKDKKINIDFGDFYKKFNDIKDNSKCKSAYWLYTIRVLNGKKQEFMDKMKEQNIMTSQVHNRNDINSCVKEFEEILPNLDILEKELVCIPVGWWLTRVESEYIVNSISRFFYEKTLDLDNATW
tara:strand:+ start:271 stop:867 length:597 start_codon:yes stop_codon:yes gene_type:complete